MIASVWKYAGNPTVLLAIAIGVVFGFWKWEGYKRTQAETYAEGVKKSLTMAQAELDRAASINRGALLAAENASKEAARQAKIAQAAAKKSQDRLRENNLLRRNIQNVTDNPPVPDSIELVLDALRVRGAVPGPNEATSGTDESGNEGEASPDRPVVQPKPKPTS